MPTVEISKKDLEKLCKRKFSEQELYEVMMYAKGEIDSIERDEIKVDIKQEKSLHKWINYIKEETRSKKVTFLDKPTGKHVKKWNIDEKKIEIGIKK